LLRDSLRFDGLVVTDALDMGALVAHYGGGEAAVRAFEAGSDLLLMPANPAEAIGAMVEAVKSGRVSRERLRQSVGRVLKMKEQLGLFRRRTVSLERLPRVVGRKAFSDTARAVAARSVVLVRDSGAVVTRLRSAPAQVTVVTYADPSATPSFATQLARRGHRVTSFRLFPVSGPASYDSARTVLERSPIAVFAVAVKVTSGSGSIAMPPALAALIETASQAQPTVLVSFGSPYLLSQSPSPQVFLLAWTSNQFTEEAAARALTGAAVTGRLPIDLPPGYRIGDGLALPSTEVRALGARR
jgi:beta-N-acetylhexosaminidase